jgi:hypothetical protein
MPFDGEIDWVQTIRDFRALEAQVPVLFELRDCGPEMTGLPRLAEVMRRMEDIH